MLTRPSLNSPDDSTSTSHSTCWSNDLTSAASHSSNTSHGELLLISLLKTLKVGNHVLENLEKDGYIQSSSILPKGDQLSLPSYLEDELTRILKLSDRPNSHLNSFQFEQKLGNGAFGVVLKCKHTTDNNSYALKIIPFKKGEDKNQVIREVDILSKLSHENIVRYHQSFIEHHVPKEFEAIFYENEIIEEPIEKYDFLVIQMECCSKSLECCLGKIDPDYATYYLKQILSGLSQLHKNGKVHGDIKPSNILLVDKVNKVKIGDFGLSNDSIRELFSQGTKRYQKEVSNFSESADLYALAISYFEMLSNYTNKVERYRSVHDLKENPTTFNFPTCIRDLDKKLIIEMMTIPCSADSLIDNLDKRRYSCKICNIIDLIVGIDKFIIHLETPGHQKNSHLQLPQEPVQALDYISKKFNIDAPVYTESAGPSGFLCAIEFYGFSYTTDPLPQKKPAKNDASKVMLDLVRDIFVEKWKTRCLD